MWQTLSGHVTVFKSPMNCLILFLLLLLFSDHIDFEVGNLTVVIPKSRSNSNRICGTVTVTVLDDLVAEGDEIFTVFLEAQDKPSRVVIDSRGEQNITIVDDDSESLGRERGRGVGVASVSKLRLGVSVFNDKQDQDELSSYL